MSEQLGFIDYEVSVDFINYEYNAPPTKPIIQGTSIEFKVTLLENGSIAVPDEGGVFDAYIVAYNKLDSKCTILADKPLTVTPTTVGDDNHYGLAISGVNLTSHAGLCSLVIKYEKDNNVSFSNPLQYYVKENPVYTPADDTAEEDNNE